MAKTALADYFLVPMTSTVSKYFRGSIHKAALQSEPHPPIVKEYAANGFAGSKYFENTHWRIAPR
jgi:hypothetical protein